MGQVYKPNLALSTSLIASLLKKLLLDVDRTNLEKEKFDLIIFGSYLVVSYVLSLRGSEGLMLNLTTIKKELDKPRDFCLIALKGKVKGESAERDHILPCVKVTKSKINVQVWLRMLCVAHAMTGRKGGPAITSWEGQTLSTSHLDGLLHYYLTEMLENKEEFPFEIKTDDDICERISVC